MGFESLMASPFFWLGIAVLAAVVEMVSVSLITVWFVVGALAAFFVGYFGGSIVAQLVTFLVISLACLALLRPVILKYRKRGEQHEPTLIGKQALVVEPVGGLNAGGRIRTQDGVTWTAFSTDGCSIEAGAQVRIVRQESIKLFVEKV